MSVDIFLVASLRFFYTWTQGVLAQAGDALVATQLWCDASERYIRWQTENPTLCAAESEEGRVLLIQYIDAYENFLRTHPYIKGHAAYLAYLRSQCAPCVE